MLINQTPTVVLKQFKHQRSNHYRHKAFLNTEPHFYIITAVDLQLFLIDLLHCMTCICLLFCSIACENVSSISSSSFVYVLWFFQSIPQLLMSRTPVPLKCVTAETGGVWEEMLLRFSEDAGLDHRSSARRGGCPLWVWKKCWRNAWNKGKNYTLNHGETPVSQSSVMFKCVTEGSGWLFALYCELI